jgi:hypothetical protein
MMVFINIYIQFQVLTRIRNRNLELWIRIRQKVSNPCGSGSTTLIQEVGLGAEGKLYLTMA